MKNLFASLLALILTGTISAQVSLIVDETWHNRNVLDSFVYEYPHYTTDFNLQFSETSEGYEMIINGVANVFTAQITFDPAAVTMTIQDFEVTTNPCETLGCEYESYYFYSFLTDSDGSFKTFEYDYFEISNGNQIFRLTDINGRIAEFSDETLPLPDEALFRTWYLHVMGADLWANDYISDFEPPIYPTLTIHEDLSYDGIGSCNTFTGTFNYSVDIWNTSFLIQEEFEEAGLTCEFHNGFEAYYFENFAIADYPLTMEVYEDTEGASFSFEKSPGFFFRYYDQPILTTSEFETSKVLLYPNPVEEVIYIEGVDSINFQRITIFNMLGEIIMEVEHLPTNSLNVAALPAGLFLIKMKTDTETLTEKLVKK
ncbi:T9SS type A sorting domain-containing protein [Flavobacteriaceae bacterium TK19130]|nr:T9SS type A sorting domain-containing protein [Thermobacterium salinum]